MNNNKLKGKDLVNVGIYSAIYFVIVLALAIMFSSENAMIVSDALTRIDSILEMKPLPEPISSQSPKSNSVELENVCFRYPNAKVNALDGVSLRIAPGEHIALVGPSGGGKTTLASIIARFWDVTAGSVKIGGVDVKNIKKSELMNHAQICALPQGRKGYGESGDRLRAFLHRFDDARWL